MRGRGDHGRRWYLFDDLGSVLAEVSRTGTITSSRNYDVYGNARSGVNANGTSAQKFVGQLGHPSDNNTGLVYMQARYPLLESSMTAWNLCRPFRAQFAQI